jgi:hypothetical protein
VVTDADMIDACVSGLTERGLELLWAAAQSIKG